LNSCPTKAVASTSRNFLNRLLLTLSYTENTAFPLYFRLLPFIGGTPYSGSLGLEKGNTNKNLAFQKNNNKKKKPEVYWVLTNLRLI